MPRKRQRGSTHSSTHRDGHLDDRRDDDSNEVISSSSVSGTSDSDTDISLSGNNENYLTPSVNPVYKSYADRLSVFEDRGLVGDTEQYDEERVIQRKSKQLAQLIQHTVRHKKRIIVLTGAGISTSCGIPDFRGTNGVWTIQEKQYHDAIKQQRHQHMKQEDGHENHEHQNHMTDGKASKGKRGRLPTNHSVAPLTLKNET